MGHSFLLLAVLLLSPYIAVFIAAVWFIARISRRHGPIAVRVTLGIAWVGLLYFAGLYFPVLQELTPIAFAILGTIAVWLIMARQHKTTPS